MFARIAGAKIGNSCDQRCWAVFKIEDKKVNLSLLQQNSFLETPFDIFGEESSKEPEILKELEFLTG